ncbi:hypothetical protein ACFWA6_14670 [Streptomyces sp. NPDC060020]|uniref:hypothetical protein n=1 Tax=Streptomyces sp. NPDC060020 TaxID=3347038 RepID=UPI003693E15B
MRGSLRDVVALADPAHAVDVEVRACLAVAGQCLRLVVAQRVDLALGVRLAARSAVDLVVGVRVREVDAPVAEARVEGSDEAAVDTRVLVGDLLAVAADDVRDMQPVGTVMVMPPTW